MPYKNELANKASHGDIVKNPDVEAFLKNCEYLRQPNDTEIREILSSFKPFKFDPSAAIPQKLIATDGSIYEAMVSEKFPSTRIAYLKFGTVLINVQQYRSLNFEETKLLDPFKVAALEDNNRAVTLVLPSANVTLNGKKTVKESFRHTLESWLQDERTRIDEDHLDTCLSSTLGLLNTFRTDELRSGDPNKIRVHKCPTCLETPSQGYIEVDRINGAYCPSCKAKVLASDCLRIWEEVSEFQSNGTAIGRLMNVVEHMLPVHYIHYLLQRNPEILGDIVFFVDGPLAVFGNCAWLHGCILRYLTMAFDELRSKGLKVPTIIGLQKTGQLNDFAVMLEPNLEPGSVLLVNDQYRYRYIYAGREEAQNGFGDETYYGQDFLLKTPSGKMFVFAVPYPTSNKRPKAQFQSLKNDYQSYPQLQSAIDVIHHFESDLYKNAIVPVALAHKYTSISLVPGGRVLDLLSRSLVRGNKEPGSSAD